MRSPLLLAAVAATITAGVAAGARAGGAAPSYALASNLVYRLEVGTAVTGFLYLALVTVRLAWAGETFTKFSAGVAGAEAPDLAAAGEELEIVREQVEELTSEVAAALGALADRLDRLEGRPAGGPPPGGAGAQRG